MGRLDTLTPSTSLLRYEALSSRKNLSPTDKRRYSQLQKGFIGEKRLATSLQSQHCHNVVPLFNNLFESMDKDFEIDCLLLTSDTIFLLEIKNYTGNYYVENNHIYHFPSKKQIYNPVTQLDRTEFLFKRLLSDMQVTMKVRSFVVFVNHHFVLYEAPIQFPIIFPSQINSFLEKTNRNAPQLSSKVEQLANLLIRRRKVKSNYERLPSYKMEELKKGIFCMNCSIELGRSNRNKFTCVHCQQAVTAIDVVLYSTAQYHLLFPEEKITTNNIFEWCGQHFSKNFVRKILANHLIAKSTGRHTHYLYKNQGDHLEVLYKFFKLA